MGLLEKPRAGFLGFWRHHSWVMAALKVWSKPRDDFLWCPRLNYEFQEFPKNSTPWQKAILHLYVHVFDLLITIRVIWYLHTYTTKNLIFHDNLQNLLANLSIFLAFRPQSLGKRLIFFGSPGGPMDSQRWNSWGIPMGRDDCFFPEFQATSSNFLNESVWISWIEQLYNVIYRINRITSTNQLLVFIESHIFSVGIASSGSWQNDNVTQPRRDVAGVPSNGRVCFRLVIGGFHSHGGTPIARWFMSWKIPWKWMINRGVPPFMETANYEMIYPEMWFEIIRTHEKPWQRRLVVSQQIASPPWLWYLKMGPKPLP